VADKIKSVANVVASIPNGAHVALGGFAIARNVICAVHELIRQGKRNLTVSQGVAGLDTDLLVGAGVVGRLIIGGGSLDRFGPVHCINRGREQMSLAFEDWTSLSICFRYLAGALGLSFMPIKSLIASEILERLEKNTGVDSVKRMKCPFTNEDYLLLRALSPDVSFLHVQAADAEGNCRIDGPRWDNEEQAKAAKRIIVIAEEIVPTSVVQEEPERTIIPAHRVEAVIHQPYGAYPTAVFGRYDYDAKHLEMYVDCAKRANGAGEYIDRFIRSTKSHQEFLRRAGAPNSLVRIKADPALGY